MRRIFTVSSFNVNFAVLWGLSFETTDESDTNQRVHFTNILSAVLVVGSTWINPYPLAMLVDGEQHSDGKLSEMTEKKMHSYEYD